MIIAALGDIRGNLAALEAVLAAIDAAGIHTVVHTGNAVVGQPYGATAAALLMERGVVCVRGEIDRRLVRFRRKERALRQRLDEETVEALAAAHEALGSEALEWIRSLPPRKSLTIDGVRTMVCHGAPSSAADILNDDTPLVRFEREREIEVSDVVVCGGAPEPFSRRVEGTLFVGPGFVDLSAGTARYAVISTETEPWSATFPEVAYP